MTTVERWGLIVLRVFVTAFQTLLSAIVTTYAKGLPRRKR